MDTPSVVVGTDGSAESLRTVEWAAREAGRRGAVLRVVSVPEVWPYDEPPGKVSDVAAAKAAASAELADAEKAAESAARRAAELLPDLRVEISVPAGSPAEQLIASSQGAQLLVTGCRGSGGFSGLILGSVSRYLATHAPLPVVVVREETMWPANEIVVGVRSPHLASAPLRFAFTEAALRGTGLVLIEALPPGRMAEIADVNGDVRATTKQVLDTCLMSWQREFPGVPGRTEVVLAHPGRVLTAASARAELVVIGRPGRLGGAVGAVMHAVLGHAHGPVAVVPGD